MSCPHRQADTFSHRGEARLPEKLPELLRQRVQVVGVDDGLQGRGLMTVICGAR